MNDKFLIFNIEKMASFIFSNSNDRTNDVEITEVFEYDSKGKLNPTNKVVKEVKVNQNTIRYDLIKMFIDILDSVDDVNIMTIGQRIVFNTMETYGLITEIKSDK